MKAHAFLLLMLLSLAGCGERSSRSRLSPKEIETLGALRKSDPRSAVVKLKQQLETKPRDDTAWTLLGHSYEDLDQDEEADAAYRKALEINPRQFQALTGIGILSSKKGKLDEAMAYYEKAIIIDPSYAQGYSSMTVIALKRGQDVKALEYAQKGYDLDKTDPVVAANLAVAYHYNGKLELRDKMTEEAQKLGYQNVDALQKIYKGEATVRE
jgi:Tfp pilus assembly protein PilF